MFASLEFWSTQVCVYNMASRKPISHDLREATVASNEWVKGYKVISNQFKTHHSRIVYKLRGFKAVANLPRSGYASKFSQRSGI